MAITRVYPATWATVGEGVVVLVDSDAATDAEAILEVERWCDANGFERARENWPARRRTPDGVLVRRAVCYRMYSSEAGRDDDGPAPVERHVAGMALTRSAAELEE